MFISVAQSGVRCTPREQGKRECKSGVGTEQRPAGWLETSHPKDGSWAALVSSHRCTFIPTSPPEAEIFFQMSTLRPDTPYSGTPGPNTPSWIRSPFPSFLYPPRLPNCPEITPKPSQIRFNILVCCRCFFRNFGGRRPTCVFLLFF